MDTIVLGGGLIGQYAAHKLDAKLITVKPEKSIPYIFLHDDPENRHMLDELKVDFGTGRWHIGFMHKGEVLEAATESMVSEYHNKCYGHPPKVPQFKSPYYDLLTPNYYEVRKKLEDLNKDVVYGKAIFLDLLQKEIMLEDRTHFRYKRLVSTIPLPDLLHMAGVEATFSFKPIYYYKLTQWDSVLNGFDTVQVMDGSDPRTRFVKGTAEPNTYFLETLKESTDFGVLSQVIKYGKIINDGWQLDMRNNALTKLESQNVFCFGRFARWTQHYDTQHALRDLRKFTERDDY